MSYTDREESILKKEYEMWEAASKRDVVTCISMEVGEE